jgi:hypothetical protein
MKKLLALLLLCVPVASGGHPTSPPIDDLWFTYHIEPTQYLPVPNSAPHYTNEWFEEIELPYIDPAYATLRSIEFYIVQSTEYQIKFENLDNNITGWPTTWDRVNHQVKFYLDEGPYVHSNFGINSFTEGGGGYTVWCPFDGTIDGKGCSGWSSPKIINAHFSRDVFNVPVVLEWINGHRKGGYKVKVEGRTRFLFNCPEALWVMQFIDNNSVDLRVRYILE